MGKYKEHPKYNVVSMRITDDERSVLEALMRHRNKSISRLMREAIELYTPHLESRFVQ
jgi:predicted DNA-binding protein